MAPDPRKRYATAAEARHLLNLVIYGAPEHAGAGGVSRASAAARPRPSALPAAPRAAAAAGGRGAPRAAARALVGLLVAARSPPARVVGTVAAGGDSAPAAARRASSAAGMSVELPDGWRAAPGRGRPARGLPGAQPRRPGLTVAISHRAAWSARIGARRCCSASTRPGDQRRRRAEDGGRVAQYVIPTKSGKVEITCAAAPGAPSNTLALCERRASTLQLGSQRTCRSTPWRRAAAALGAGRRAPAARTAPPGARDLAAAERQTGQIQAADALARTHERAARRFAGAGRRRARRQGGRARPRTPTARSPARHAATAPPAGPRPRRTSAHAEARLARRSPPARCKPLRLRRGLRRRRQAPSPLRRSCSTRSATRPSWPLA